MKRSVLLGLLLVVTVGSQCREQPSQIETGYDWQPPVKSDSPPTDMPIEYRWRLTERRLYPPPTEIQDQACSRSRSADLGQQLLQTAKALW